MTLERDGRLGLAAFQREKFDLCLLDVMMPHVDGFTLAEEIRDIDPEVPLFFLSAKTLKEDIMKYYYRALQYYYDERYFDAIAELSKAKMINSSIPEIYIRLGSIYWTLGLREEAVDNWKTAYNLDKNNDSLNAFLKTNGISLEKQEVINDKKSKI